MVNYVNSLLCQGDKGWPTSNLILLNTGHHNLTSCGPEICTILGWPKIHHLEKLYLEKLLKPTGPLGMDII